MTWSSLETWSYLANVAVVAFGILAAVAGGVAWHLSNLVDERKDAALEQFRADSDLRLGQANQAAAEANRKAAEAGEGTAKAAAVAGKANERASRLEIEAAKQRERAATAERALLELQQRLAWRTIDGKHEKEIVSLLSPFAGERVVIFAIAGSEEISSLATQLQSLLQRAGLTVDMASGTIFSRAESGVQLSIGEQRIPLAQPIAEALVLAGIAKKPVPATKDANGETLTIWIWPK